MSDKIKRAQALSSAKSSVKTNKVQVEGFADLVDKLQKISVATQKSHEDVMSAIQQLSQVIVMAGEDAPDMAPVVSAIKSLEARMMEKKVIPMDYVLNFERDKFGLMKSGIELTARQKRLN